MTYQADSLTAAFSRNQFQVLLLKYSIIIKDCTVSNINK